MSEAAGTTGTAPDEPTTWLNQRERGTLWLMRLSFAAALRTGRPIMRAFVALIALWYTLFDRRAVAASRDWLGRVLDEPVRWRHVYRHMRTFVQVTLDRVFLLGDRTRGMTFDRTGDHLLREQLATGHGALLLGAHLGSYEAMRAGGVDDEVPIHILGYFENARMINALLDQLAPDHAARVLHLGDDPVGVMAGVRGRVDAGDFVAILGDRVGLNDRSIEVEFFGEPAPFATGPLLLAHLLRCPVYFVCGLYTPPGRYSLHCEVFAESIDLPRKGRDEALRELVQAYARRIEHHARSHPYNWFNFFDFWKSA